MPEKNVNINVVIADNNEFVGFHVFISKYSVFVLSPNRNPKPQ